MIGLFDEKTLSAQPVAVITGRTAASLAGIDPGRFPAAEQEEAKKKLADESQMHVWTDRNGDRQIQLDEIVAERTAAPKGALWGLYWGAWVNDDLTIWCASPFNNGYVWRIPVQEFLPDGTPVYPPPSRQQPIFTAQYKLAIHSVLPAADGRSVYLIEQGEGATGAGSPMAVSRYALDGRRLWAYRKTYTGFALDAPMYRPGLVIGAMKFCGLADLDLPQNKIELVMVNGYPGQFNLLTGDGLWVATLASDNRVSPAMSEHTYYVENFSGFFFRNRDNGKYYYIAGETDTRIMEVTGLETVRTAATPWTLTETDVARARDVARRKLALGGAKPPIVVHPMSATAAGKPAPWQFDDYAAIDAGGGHTVRFALGRDDATLYAAFDVKDESPMRNAGSDYAMLFKTGDTCELMLAADPMADPHRKRPAAGDMRLLLSEMDGRPVAVLYEPVLRAGRSKAERVFSSPTGSETFARVAILKDVRISIQRSKDGYRLEAAVPLASLGLSLAKGASLRGDLGVLFSNPGGNAVGRRAYYFNQETQITQDVPSEARLQPANWGTFTVE